MSIIPAIFILFNVGASLKFTVLIDYHGCLFLFCFIFLFVDCFSVWYAFGELTESPYLQILCGVVYSLTLLVRPLYVQYPSRILPILCLPQFGHFERLLLSLESYLGGRFLSCIFHRGGYRHPVAEPGPHSVCNVKKRLNLLVIFLFLTAKVDGVQSVF